MTADRPRLHPDNGLNCLLISPQFPGAFWNWTEVCRAMKRRAMAAPLGLITFAATLPHDWRLRLVDLNVTDWDEESWQWADLVCVGGMIPQQTGILEVIERARREGKFVVAGGVDVTSQPDVYQQADAQVLGEAESSVPVWLDALRGGNPTGRFHSGQRPDITASPVPRFDLLDVSRYLGLGVQYSRGCPFECEFCDIIELFGRTPRTKTPEQLCRELDVVYESGHRGWIDIVDDNFVGNKPNVRQMLPVLEEWCRGRGFPFYFTTQASMNLAEEKELMRQMSTAGFRLVFLGIESPDEVVLRTTKKRINTSKSISDRVQNIYEHGLGLTAGFILGLDGESDDTADNMIQCIEENALPIATPFLLCALPNTQLARRLKREKRLLDSQTSQPVTSEEQYKLLLRSATGTASSPSDTDILSTLNFITKRDRYRTLEDFRRIWMTIYDPKRFFPRLLRAAKRIKAKKVYRPRFSDWRRQTWGLAKIVWKLSRKRDIRWPLWRLILRCFFLGVPRLEYAMHVLVGYAQLEQIRGRIAESVPRRIHGEQEIGVPRQWQPQEGHETHQEEPIA